MVGIEDTEGLAVVGFKDIEGFVVVGATEGCAVGALVGSTVVSIGKLLYP